MLLLSVFLLLNFFPKYLVSNPFFQLSCVFFHQTISAEQLFNKRTNQNFFSIALLFWNFVLLRIWCERGSNVLTNVSAENKRKMFGILKLTYNCTGSYLLYSTYLYKGGNVWQSNQHTASCFFLLFYYFSHICQQESLC